ncbi:hypothetical protein MATL_G00152420 [Megalops atlanticus]|uniref:ShKT domain-containing protein n=1 Tax=Megalops atlanticus TaxID=7932 RepID=A0A9D3PWV4_MEGAT|nr:hypothetical protein MATL_G00152420 [Megalops atlanticus]
MRLPNGSVVECTQAVTKSAPLQCLWDGYHPRGACTEAVIESQCSRACACAERSPRSVRPRFPLPPE